MCYTFHGKVAVCDGGSAVIAELHCKRWGCPDCGPRRLEQWRQRIGRLTELDDRFERTVCRSRLEFRALSARLKRAGCEFVKIVTTQGIEVFHQAFRGNRQTEADPAGWMTGDRMKQVADSSLRRLRHQEGQRCLTASSGVPRYHVEPGRQWRVAARFGLSIEEVNRRAQAGGYTKEVRPGRIFPTKVLDTLVGEGFELSPEVYEAPVVMKDRAAAMTASVRLVSGSIF